MKNKKKKWGEKWKITKKNKNTKKKRRKKERKKRKEQLWNRRHFKKLSDDLKIQHLTILEF